MLLRAAMMDRCTVCACVSVRVQDMCVCSRGLRPSVAPYGLGQGGRDCVVFCVSSVWPPFGCQQATGCVWVQHGVHAQFAAVSVSMLGWLAGCAFVPPALGAVEAGFGALEPQGAGSGGRVRAPLAVAVLCGGA